MSTLISYLLTVSLGWSQPTPDSETPKAGETKSTDPAQSQSASPPTGESPITPNTSQSVFSVINEGLEENVSLIRVSLAAKREQSQLQSVTRAKLQSNPTKLLGQGTLTFCDSQKDSMARLRRRIEKAENSLYFGELQQALSTLKEVGDTLNCLEGDIDIESLSNLFYLQGLVYFELGQEKEAANAYTMAFNFLPSKAWNDSFPDASKQLFDDIKKSLKTSPKVNFYAYPMVGGSSVFIDGIDVRNGEEVTKGRHLVSVERVGFAWLDIPDDAETISMVIPQHLPIETLDWASDPEKQAELSMVLSGIYPKNDRVYFEKDQKVWQLTVGHQDWTSLEIPKTLIKPGTSPAVIASRVMTWGGIATLVIGGSIASYSGLQASAANRDGQTADSFDTYSQAQSRYNSSFDRYRVGIGVTTVGAALAGGGIAWTFRLAD